MGQYYKPCIIEVADGKVRVIAHLYSRDYDNGLKLMEHSYLKNPFVNTVERLFFPDGEFYKAKLVWAGDYAEKEPDIEKTLYSLCDKSNKITPKKCNSASNKFRYIVNHDAKLFVDKKKLVNIDGWIVHPLPLLTSEGCFQGGGDYWEDSPDSNLVGTWARCSISIEQTIPDGYVELKVRFAY